MPTQVSVMSGRISIFFLWLVGFGYLTHIMMWPGCFRGFVLGMTSQCASSLDVQNG